MNAAMKAALLTLLIVGIGFALMTFLGDSGPPTISEKSRSESSSPVNTGPTPGDVGLQERTVEKVNVFGSVRDENGTPLPGAVVTLSALDGSRGLNQATLVTEKNVDNDGKFQFEDLDPGLYRFKGTLNGYQSHRLDVAVIEGSGTPTVELVLSSGMSISGTIFDPLGKPVAGAQVAAFKERVEADAPLQKRLQVLLDLPEMQEENGIVATSDESGFYQVVGLEDLSYRLQVVASGFAPAEKRYIAAASSEVDFMLELGGMLTGTVQDPGGIGVADALVEIYRQTGTQDIIEIIQERAMPPLASRQTDGSGFFEFNELGGGSNFRLVARAERYQPRQFENLQVESGGTASVDVVLSPGEVIQGTVYDPDGNVLEGALCKVNQMGARSEGPPIDLTDDGIESNGSGEFVFDTLAEADYRLIVSFPDFATYQELRIRPGDDPLNIQLGEGAAISGSVLDVETNGPIAGAVVTVNDVADVKKTAVTDGNGGYYVRGITEQRRPIAYVSVTATGYTRSGNEQVEVADGAETPGANFYLERNGVVSGVVVSANGIPIPGVSVSARKMHSEQNPVVVNAAPPVTSGSDGSFEVIEVSPGTDLFLEGSHGQYLVSQSEGFDLVAGGSMSGISLVMKIGGALSGIVIDEAGAPIEGAVVAVRDEWLGEVNPESLPNKSYSDGAGQWYISSLPDGDHTIICSVPGYLIIERSGIVVAEGRNTANIELQMVKGAALSGQVTSTDGQPIEGARVVAIDTSDGLRKLSRSTDLTGYFHFDNLGRYPIDLVIEKSGYAEVRLFEQPVDQEQLVIVRLEGLGGIRGSVRDEAGKPLRAFSVSPRIIEGDREVTRVPSRTFQSEEGRYDFDGLQPGTYNVLIGAPGFAQDVIENVVVRSNQWVDLPTAVLGQGGRVLGQIVDASSGQPIAGAKVTVVGGNRNFLTSTTFRPGGGARRDQVMTGADGYFEFIGLAVPSVKLTVAHRAYITESVDGVLSGTADLVIAIGAGGIIEGRVSDLDGNFLAGTQVLLSGGIKGTDARSQTDRKGFFSFPGLPSGNYVVRVTNFGRGDGTPTDIKNAPTFEVQVDAGRTEFLEVEIEI
ncbi:MAG: carboxypeptidase-like regulatory domain-containing protein [Planctomycetota bacterium]|nr:carboxypeptidase-like regulatory domain-containing protein [Planctomycetota bacterium]